jgi:hypothetical protein
MDNYSYSNEGWNLHATVFPDDVFDKEYNKIRDEIVAAANRAVPKTARQRLQFWKD